MTRCPFCNEQLVRGYIKTIGEVISWSKSPPQKKTAFTSRWHAPENDIKFGEYSLLKGATVVAYKCNKCNKIIIDTSIL